MDEAQFEALTRQIVGAMRNNLEFPWADITIYLVIFGITFFASLLSSRLHSYFSKRAEYAAQVKDLKKLDRVESTITRSTEEIKSYIAGRLWVDQRFWELKREIYWQLCSVLQRLSDSISEILQPDFREARRLAGGQNDLTEPPVRLIRLQHELIGLTASCHIVLAHEARDLLENFVVRSKECLGPEIISKEQFENMKRVVDDTYDKMVEIARADLKTKA